MSASQLARHQVFLRKQRAALSPMYVPAAVRKCSIARLQEVADMYPACDRLEYFAVALLGVRTRRCLISDLIYDDHLGSQTLGAPYSVSCS